MHTWNTAVLTLSSVLLPMVQGDQPMHTNVQQSNHPNRHDLDLSLKLYLKLVVLHPWQLDGSRKVPYFRIILESPHPVANSFWAGVIYGRGSLWMLWCVNVRLWIRLSINKNKHIYIVLLWYRNMHDHAKLFWFQHIYI